MSTQYNDEEKWLRVCGHPEFFVSSHGRIRGKRGGILKYRKEGRYFRVGLATGTGSKDVVSVHRLVAFSFVINPDPSTLTMVDHINHDTLDNHYTNLRFVTRSQNGLNITPNPDRGLRNSKIVQCFNQEGVLLMEDRSKNIVRNTGADYKSIRRACKNKNLYLGYYWRDKKVSMYDRSHMKFLNMYSTLKGIPAGDLYEPHFIEIRDYPLYLVTQYGDVWSTTEQQWVGSRLNNSGYWAISPMSAPGEQDCLMLHRVVCIAFNGTESQSSERRTVNHIDGNKLNPFYANLEWVTSSENTNHTIQTGLQSANNASMCQFDNNLRFIRRYFNLNETYKIYGEESGLKRTTWYKRNTIRTTDYLFIREKLCTKNNDNTYTLPELYETLPIVREGVKDLKTEYLYLDAGMMGQRVQNPEFGVYVHPAI